MKLVGLALGVLLVVACPVPSPKPDPIPVVVNTPTCALDEATHDLCTDVIVTALQAGTDLSAPVGRCTFDGTVCLVHEIAADTRGAPVLLARARDWLTSHEKVTP